jgi:hypothetical protein
MTAVEKIIEYCKKQKNIDLNSHRGVYFNIIRFCEDQAKAMEKEQKIEFACQVAEASAMKYIQGKTTRMIAEELIKSE